MWKLLRHRLCWWWSDDRIIWQISDSLQNPLLTYTYDDQGAVEVQDPWIDRRKINHKKQHTMTVLSHTMYPQDESSILSWISIAIGDLLEYRLSVIVLQIIFLHCGENDIRHLYTLLNNLYDLIYILFRCFVIISPTNSYHRLIIQSYRKSYHDWYEQILQLLWSSQIFTVWLIGLAYTCSSSSCISYHYSDFSHQYILSMTRTQHKIRH